MRTISLNPPLALLTGVVGVSTGAIFVRLADAQALVTAMYRVGLAVIILFPFFWWTAGKELKQLTRKDLGVTMLAGLFLALHFATWISSLDYTSIANSVVLVNTNPLWVGILTPFLTGDKISRKTIAGIILSVCGGILIGAGDLAAGGKALFGDMLALIGSFCAAGYLILGRQLRAKLGLLAYTFVCYGTAAVVLFIMVLVAKMPLSGYSQSTWVVFICMALFAQVMGHTSYNYALKWFSANLIAISLLGEPVLASLMGWLFFKEGLTLLKIMGGALILGGIYIAAMAEVGQSRVQQE